MDKDKLMFTEPDFYRFAAQGLVNEAIRRVTERESVSEIEEWITICDQLAQATSDEIGEVVTSLLTIPYDTDTYVHESEPDNQSEIVNADIVEDSLYGDEPHDKTHEETTATTPVEEPSNQEENQVPQNQDPFGLPSFKHMGGDIFGNLSKEMGFNLSEKERNAK